MSANRQTVTAVLKWPLVQQALNSCETDLLLVATLSRFFSKRLIHSGREMGELAVRPNKEISHKNKLFFRSKADMTDIFTCGQRWYGNQACADHIPVIKGKWMQQCFECPTMSCRQGEQQITLQLFALQINFLILSQIFVLLTYFIFLYKILILCTLNKHW